MNKKNTTMREGFLSGIMIGIVAALFSVLILSDCTTNSSNTWIYWYPDSGFIILEKNKGKRFGKWEYKIKDAYDDKRVGCYIRSNQDWQVGDSILLIKN